MEIERKFLIDTKFLPFKPDSFPVRHIEQGYLCTDPVVRIRKDNNSYFLTYKSKGLMIREEYNLPLTKESYLHLREKTDGRLITKRRYVIPLEHDLKLELDLFDGDLSPLVIGEIEFPDEKSARTYTPPHWFGKEVTGCPQYFNNNLSLNLPSAAPGK